MAHKFVIEKNKAGEFVAKFKYNAETIFWTEGYTSKASARNAIESILKNGPAAEVEDHSAD
ncbi:YegP family protein [Sphingomonas sp. FW199]|uniref:YegP family protein n=1 Tax=Sphingomonas sp. FW199 TaxID=3400217 RepID=UPI003CF74C6F